MLNFSLPAFSSHHTELETFPNFDVENFEIDRDDNSIKIFDRNYMRTLEIYKDGTIVIENKSMFSEEMEHTLSLLERGSPKENTFTTKFQLPIILKIHEDELTLYSSASTDLHCVNILHDGKSISFRLSDHEDIIERNGAKISSRGRTARLFQISSRKKRKSKQEGQNYVRHHSKRSSNLYSPYAPQ